MSSETMSLSDLQRTMATTIMMPLTPDEGMRETSPDGRSMAEIASSFIAPNSRLAPFERLEIYNRQYWFRVLGALAEDFPALRAVLGEERFAAMSVAYLTAHPSRSFTLRNLGSKLVDWLNQHPEVAGRRNAIAVDVAKVEWAFIEAFDNAERAPLTLDQIATLDGDSRLALQPHLRLIALNYEADDLALALHKHEKRQTSEAGVQHAVQPEAPVHLPRLRRRPIWVAAHRVDLSVYYRRLVREEFLALTDLANGKPLGEALEDSFTHSRTPESRRPDLVRAWFTTWAELGWVCAPELDSLLQT